MPDRKEKQRQWYLKNRERVLVRAKARWALLKDDPELKARNKAYRDTHKAERRARNERLYPRYSQSVQRAKKCGIEHVLTFAEYQTIIEGNLCHYCGRPVEKAGSGLDRKDNSKGYSADNCVSCCKRCNLTFNALYSYEEKLILAEAIKLIDARR